MNNAEYLAHFLKAKGVDHVFELTGGMITFLLDAMSGQEGLRIVSMHHEQGAAFAAEGWARVKGLPGVALATSGPGATNLITGIGSCFFDSVPALFITGQVNTHEQKTRPGVRQQGFQETAIVDMVRPVTKAAYLVNNPADLPRILEEAFQLSISGRPGPVLVDIPMDVQRAKAVEEPPTASAKGPRPCSASPSKSQFLSALAKAISVSSRPLILAGGGVRSGNATELFRALVDKLKLPVVYSLMGVDVIPDQSDEKVGLIGSYGNRWANLALSEADFLLVLGSRLDIRQTGSDVPGFKNGRVIFHVDIAEEEMNNRVQGCETLACDLGDFLQSALAELPSQSGLRPVWSERLGKLQEQYPASNEIQTGDRINPIHLLAKAFSLAGEMRAFVTDVGQHQMWSAQTASLTDGQRFLTSGGMGAMGFALPTGIGASLAAGPTMVIAGDGGFQLNIQELQTIARNRLPVKILIINNGCHGMVRQFQESYFKSRFQSTVWGYSAPDFVAVARAYSIEAASVTNPAEVDSALLEFLRDPSRPALLEVRIDQNTNVYPKLAFGKPFGHMEPDSTPLEMEGT